MYVFGLLLNCMFVELLPQSSKRILSETRTVRSIGKQVKVDQGIIWHIKHRLSRDWPYNFQKLNSLVKHTRNKQTHLFQKKSKGNMWTVITSANFPALAWGKVDPRLIQTIVNHLLRKSISILFFEVCIAPLMRTLHTIILVGLERTGGRVAVDIIRSPSRLEFRTWKIQSRAGTEQAPPDIYDCHDLERALRRHH